MFSIINSVEISAEPRRVFQAIATEEGQRGWWTRDCDVGSKVGDRATFRFAKEGGPMEVGFRIDELKPSATVAWTCTSQRNNPDWQDTTVRFTLVPTSQGTRVDFEHRGWRAKTPVYEMCVGGWSHFLNSLKLYVETGTGTPHGAR